ncbi:MAG: hypothetical protein HY782_28055 [Chloroflexi bacterium]|nr:hypothetical protein [Chloroflexota bacterium]
MSQVEPKHPIPLTDDKKLDPKDLLIAEFNYIASNVFQANEDRARVSSYYFVTAAAVVAAILGANLQNGSAWIYLGFMLLFALLSLIGYFTVLQLARLRIAWRDGADAMNRVVKYYIDHSTDPQVEHDLVWFKRDKKLSTQGRVESVSFLLALSVVATDFGTAIAAFMYGGQSLVVFMQYRSITVPSELNILLVIVALGLGYFYAQFQIRAYFEWVHRQPVSENRTWLERLLVRLKLMPAMDSNNNLELSPQGQDTLSSAQKTRELETDQTGVV